VKFCGNCNPVIDSLEVLRLVGDLLPDCHFVSYQESMDLLLILAGCPVNCVQQPLFSGTVLTVAGESLELVHCPAKSLPGEIAKLIKQLSAAWG